MKNDNPFPSDFKKKDTPEESWAKTILGPMGKMVGSSKSIYRYDNPESVVVFNANIATKESGKIWYGDIDLSKEDLKLRELFSKIGVFYIFFESDLRFEKEENPDFAVAACQYTTDGVEAISLSSIVKDKDGIPKVKKETTNEDASKKTSSFENQKEDFKEIQIPDVNQLKAKKGKSVWISFQEEFIKIHGKDQAKEFYPDLFLSSEDCKKINDLTKKVVKKTYPGLHPIKIEQAVSMDSLNYGACEFGIDPTWIKSGIGYLRKK